MDRQLQHKWDFAARTYDWLNRGDEWRFAEAKGALFSRMQGSCLFVAAGTGNDFQYFPPGLRVTAIDVSPRMLERARSRASAHSPPIHLEIQDVRALPYADQAFDTVATASTFCSVPDPVRGLRELHRCLRVGGRLLMFEHGRSRIGPIGVSQDLATLISRRIGPDMSRDIVGNVLRAGFELVHEENVYLDVVKALEGRRGGQLAPSAQPS